MNRDVGGGSVVDGRLAVADQQRVEAAMSVSPSPPFDFLEFATVSSYLRRIRNRGHELGLGVGRSREGGLVDLDAGPSVQRSQILPKRKRVGLEFLGSTTYAYGNQSSFSRRSLLSQDGVLGVREERDGLDVVRGAVGRLEEIRGGVASAGEEFGDGGHAQGQMLVVVPVYEARPSRNQRFVGKIGTRSLPLNSASGTLPGSERTNRNAGSEGCGGGIISVDAGEDKRWSRFWAKSSSKFTSERCNATPAALEPPGRRSEGGRF